MLWSKIPSRGHCQSYLEENSRGAHVGNSFTCGRPLWIHPADKNLKSFGTSTLLLTYVLSVWRVWTGLWPMPELQRGERNGSSKSRGADWLKVSTSASWYVPTLPGTWKYEKYCIFQHISMYFNSTTVFQSLSTFYVSVDKCSLLWFWRTHEQPTSKSCTETKVSTVFSKLTLGFLQVTETETYWPLSAWFLPWPVVSPGKGQGFATQRIAGTPLAFLRPCCL